MSLLDRLAGALGYRAKANGPAQGAEILPDWAEATAAYAEWGGELSDPKLYATQADRYSKSELVYACVRRKAEFGAMANLQVFKRRSDTDEPLPDHPFLELLGRPNPFLSRFQLLEDVLGCLDLQGNAYWYLHPEQGTPLSIWPLRPDRTKPVPHKREYISHYEHTVGGDTYELDPERVIHFKLWHPLKDYQGMSPVEAANYSSATDIAAQKSNWALFKNALTPSAVVESERDRVDGRQRALMEKGLLQTHTGDPGKAHKPLFLWQGFTWKEIGMKLRDAEFVEGRKMNRAGVFMVWGVHPGLVLSEDVNLANAKVAEYVFAKYTMAPLLARIGEQINLGVMRFYGDDELVRFVGVVPQDRELEAKINADYLDRGVLTINEVRADMGKDPVLWGDLPYVPIPGLGGPPMLPEGGGSRVFVLPNVRMEATKQRPLLVGPEEQPIVLDAMAYVTPEDQARARREWEEWAPDRYKRLLDASPTRT